MRTAKLVGVLLLAGLMGLRSAAGLSQDAVAVSLRINEFAWSLYRTIASAEGNLVLCPADVATALAMAYAGANGPTAAELSSALFMEISRDALLRGLGEWQKAQRKLSESSGYVWITAQKLWLPPGDKVVHTYRAALEKTLGPFSQLVGGLLDAESFGTAYDEWLRETTLGQLPAKKIDVPVQPDTAVLTSVAVFRGDWAMGFRKEDTRLERFNISRKVVEEVPIMHRIGRYSRVLDAHVEAVRVPCSGFRVAVWFILPRESVPLSEVESVLTTDQFDIWRSQAEERLMEVAIPIADIDTDLNLAPFLRAMGVLAAFSENADFSSMTLSSQLRLGAFLCRAKIGFSERGGYGSVAASVAARLTSGRPGYSIPVFLATRPFLFVVIDEITDTILLLGRVANPKLN